MTYFTKRGAPLKNPLLDIISSQRGETVRLPLAFTL